MIIETEAPILPVQNPCAIVPVNTVGVPGAGLAERYAKLCPEWAEAYRQACHSRPKGVDIGKVHGYELILPVSRLQVVVSFATKQHWRQPSQVDYVEAGLQDFVRWHATLDPGLSWVCNEISFPQLGCGLGGLDWLTQVKPLMYHYLSELPAKIYIHIYNPPPRRAVSLPIY